MGLNKSQGEAGQSVSVVVPTYNEQDNISRLLEQLSVAFADFEPKPKVVVVDDDSPDGTADAAMRTGESVPLSVEVVVRHNDPDLSRSVVRGVKEAGGDIVVVMDADLQHPPERVPELVDAVSSGSTIAVGTRHAAGGGIENWSLFRRIISLGASALAKIAIPPTRDISDPISGFFAVSMDAVDPETLSPEGYKILLEVLTQINDPDVAEVGFIFRDRERGRSSLDTAQYYRFLRHVFMCGLVCRLPD